MTARTSLRATPDWNDDVRPDAIETRTMIWQGTLPPDHPLKHAGPCSHCRYCRAPLVLDYDGRGSGWFHCYTGLHMGDPFCNHDAPHDPDCGCADWQAAIAACLNTGEPTT